MQYSTEATYWVLSNLGMGVAIVGQMAIVFKVDNMTSILIRKLYLKGLQQTLPQRKLFTMCPLQHILNTISMVHGDTLYQHT